MMTVHFFMCSPITHIVQRVHGPWAAGLIARMHMYRACVCAINKRVSQHVVKFQMYATDM